MTGPEAPSTPDLHSDSGSSEPSPSIGSFFDDPIRLRTAHSNLDARLTPFWSKSIVDRRISLSLYCVKVDLNAHSHHANESAPTNTTKDLGAPLATTEARTDDQGLFNVHVAIPWERLCTHPPALDLAFGEHSLVGRSGWEMVVKAEMAAEVPEEKEDSVSHSFRSSTQLTISRTMIVREPRTLLAVWTEPDQLRLPSRSRNRSPRTRSR
jgi:hypothetical protein